MKIEITLPELQINYIDEDCISILGFNQSFVGTNISEHLTDEFKPIFPSLLELGKDFICHFTPTSIYPNGLKLLVKVKKTNTGSRVLSFDRLNVTNIFGDEDFVKLIMDYTTDYIVIVDEGGIVKEMNRYPIGYTASDIIGGDIFTLVHESSINSYRSKFFECIKTQEVQYAEFRSVTDHYYEISFIPYKLNGENCVIIVSNDITQFHLNNKQLQDLNSQYIEILDNAPFGIVISQGKILYVNKKIADLLGRTKEEILVLPNEELWSQKSIDMVLKYAKIRLEGGNPPDEYEAELLDKNKNIVPIKHIVRIGHIPGFEGPVALSYVEDIQPQIELERLNNLIQMQESNQNRLASLGNLASGLAHEINNYMTAIIGNASLGLESVGNEEKHFNSILTASNDIRKLTKSILEFAGINYKRELKVVSIDEFIDDSESIFSPIANEINYEIESDAIIKIDSSEIRQVMINIIKNSVEAMKSVDITEPIIISLKEEQITSELLVEKNIFGNIEDGDYVTISITNKGPKIPRENLNTLFEPYYSTKGFGRGLGLPVSLGIIQAHEGMIEVESDDYTTFKLYLPICQDETNINKQPTQKITDKNNSSVLIIEDDEIVSKVVEGMLKNLNFSTFTLTNRTLAIEYIDQHLNEIDIILMDVAMPGISVSKFLEELGKIDNKWEDRVNLIFTSGFIDPLSQSDIDLERFEFLSKPYTIEELSETLSRT